MPLKPCRLLATTLLMGAGFGGPVIAQTAPDKGTGAQSKAVPRAEPAPEEAIEEAEEAEEAAEGIERAANAIVVAEDSPKPDTLWVFGTSDTEDIINSQTSAFAAQGKNVNLGATGTANVNLRGLGPERTLVLINGRRFQAGDPRAPFADVNFIPKALIKRFDYLTGGASAVYGSDAVAGIVNFIMDTNFNGLRIDAQASGFVHDNDASSGILNADAASGFRPPLGISVNGGTQDITAAYGLGFDHDNGHVTAYAGYRKQDPVPLSSRDYSFCSLAARSAVQGAGTPPRDFNCGASPVSANGTYFTNVGTFQVSGNKFVPGSTPFNFAPYNLYRRPDERYSLGVFADYEISPSAKPYLEAMFMEDRTRSQFAPSGDLFTTNTINCDNPLLSTQQFNTICVPTNTFVDSQGVTRAIAYIGRRNVEGGAREDRLRHRAWRVVAGMRGRPSGGIEYDAYYQFGTTRLSQVIRNDLSLSRLPMALDIVANPAVGGIPGVAAGRPVCRIRLTDPSNQVGQGCVPWNIFQSGGVTPEALAFLEIPLRLRGRTRQTVADANVTILGDEYGIHSPWSKRGVNFNLGVEYRKESLDTRPDSAFQLGEAASQSVSVQPVEGRFDVREVFAESQVPVVTSALIEELTLALGYRHSDYRVAGRHFGIDAYKIEGRMAPIPDIAARASYNRAFRSPNVIELFTPRSVNSGGTFDPCAGPSPTATQAQCANTGVTAAQYGAITPNPANQYNALFGGNPNLSPEKADTYTIGLVVQPRWISGLAFTIDFFDINVQHTVNAIGFQAIMAHCLATGDPHFCSKIHRAPGNGSLWLSQGFVDVSRTNIGGLRTNGTDVTAHYDRLSGRSTFSLAYTATFLRKLEVDTGVEPLSGNGNGKFDCAGLYGNACGGFLTGTPSPKYRHRLRAGITFPGKIGILGQWRHLSAVKNDGLGGDCDIVAEPTCTSTVAPANRRIGAQDYFDLTLGARIADEFNFRLGANNILDRSPPIVGAEVSPAPFGNGNTFPQLYDAFGRFIFVGVTIDL